MYPPTSIVDVSVLKHCVSLKSGLYNVCVFDIICFMFPKAALAFSVYISFKGVLCNNNCMGEIFLDKN
jgi:hypothetical protein